MGSLILTKIHFITFLLFILFNNTYQIINNPQQILYEDFINYPIIYGSSEVINILLPEYKYSHNLSSKSMTQIDTFCNYSFPYMLINENYLYSKGNRYLISLSDSNCNSKNLGQLGLPSNSLFVDYINEETFSPSSHYGVAGIEEATGLRCQALEGEVIIYGKDDTSKFIFSYIEKGKTLEFTLQNDFEDIFSCKRIVSSAYLCAFISGNKVKVIGYAYQTINPRSEVNCTMKEIMNKDISLMNAHTQIRMFDTDIETEKVICAKNKDTFKMECLKITIEFNEELETQEEVTDETENVIKIIKTNKYSLNLVYENKITFSFEVGSLIDERCIFKKSIEREYLFCCGGEDSVSCARIDNDFNFINSFFISAPGNNTDLDFVVYGSSINIIYMNTQISINYLYSYSYYRKLYEYSIIIPSCVDEHYSCIPFGSFEDSSQNLVKKEINSDYYILFTDFPAEYGNMTINSEVIDLTTMNPFLASNANKFGFMSSTEESIKNVKINYIISISETFSSECYVYLDILECYKSCQICTKSAEESTSENHNCMPNSCKDSYFLDPDIDTNCWDYAEGKLNWYIDYTNKKFEYCNDLCASCTGPQDTDCLSCKSNSEYKYLLNGKCYTECQDGYFASSFMGYYKCEQCFQTCATCKAKGSPTDMKCTSCKENHIRYLPYCFLEVDAEEKTFLDPMDNVEKSCNERLGLKIIANTYECTNNVPSEGYYLSNTETGLYSPCHSDCRTCEGKATEDNTKCTLCSNEDLNFLNGNCLENCPIGYYSLAKSDTNAQKKCNKCYSKCLSCEKGQEYNSNNKITKMNCLQCGKGPDPNNSNNLIDKYIRIDVNCFPFSTYNEEKITFDITDIKVNSEENSIKGCIDFGLSIFYGDYECKPKPSNTYYVLQNEENTGVIQYCDVACTTCYGAPNLDLPDTNCITCSEGYFRTEDSETNCILESSIESNYYKNLDDNIYYKCFSNCNTCKREMEHKADISDMGCLTCITDFYKVSQTNNCFDNSFLDENTNYFLSSDDNEFHRCYDSCKRCSSFGVDENHQNCDECIDDYYFEQSTKNCYDSSYTEKGYYLDTFTINIESGELPQFKKCYEKCKTCSNYLIDEDMNCISCIEDYYRKIDTNNCITDITNQGYYAKGDIAYPCEENCLTCSDGKTKINENNVNNNNIIITNITNNCLSCDQNTKDLYLVENINNCEPIDFKQNGYYLKEESNGVKIFHQCFKSCSLCEKYLEIDPETNKENHNCDECAENYYPKLNDENEKNCYNEEMIEELGEGLRLVRNVWQICHENCGSCEIGPTYEGKNLISQNCDTCYTGFNFIYGTIDCIDESYLEKGYYFDDSDGYYKKCDISCISCEKGSTEEDPKCIKCNNAGSYFKAENKPNNICYNSSTITPGYTLSPRYDENNNLYRIWSLCYETCIYCLRAGTEEDHGCSTCISKHLLIYNTSNCVTEEYAYDHGYYYNSTYGQYYRCDRACINCKKGPINGNTNCEKCNYEENYYPIEEKTNRLCYNNETIGEGYYLNVFSEPYKWSPCYENCATCQFLGNKNKMNCLSCKKSLKNKFNKFKYFLFMNGNCIEACPDELFLTKEGDCVSECPDGTYHYHLNWNYSCVDFCPDLYVISPDGKKCVLPEFQSYVSSNDFKKIISEDITSYVNSSRIIELDNLKAEIFYSSDLNLKSEVNNKISGIKNLENSLLTLKGKNNIPEDEPLIIVLIESKEMKKNNENINTNTNNNLISLGKDIQLLIYDKSGNKLELSDCENEQILITKNLADLPYIDFYKSKDLFQKGIDAFNESDPFFNEICYPFKTNYSSDITLSDRRTSLFQNVSFCDSGCIYKGIDYELMIVNCLCYIDSINEDNDEELNGIVLNNNKNDFPKKISNTNIILMKCTNLAFDTNLLKNNIGFYLTLIPMVFESIFLLVFAKNGFKSIKNFMLIFDPISAASPPKLKNLLSIGETNNKKNENTKQEEIKKSKLIDQLLNHKSKIKENKKQKNEIDDALVVKYSQSDSEGYDSNRKSLNGKKNNKKEDEKVSNSGYDSESDKEKKTKLTRRNKERKKTDKRNNLVQPGYNTQYDEKPKNKKEKNDKKYMHPMDMDTLSVNKNNQKKKNQKSKNNKDDINESLSNPEDNKEDDYYENIKRKKNRKNSNKIEENEKKSQKKKNKSNIKEEDDELYNKKTIIPYRSNNKKLSNISKQKEQKDMYTFSSEEYLIMNYEEAIKNDKRSWSKMYYGFLLENNCILYTFVSESFIDVRSLKINFFVFRLEIFFVLNALLFTDSYISKAYYNNGKLELFTSLPKALLSFLISILVHIILKLFSNNKKEIYKAIKEKDDKIEYSELVKIVLNKIKKKLIIFFIFQFIASFFSLYYATAFCAVYQNSNYYWFYGCLETIAIDIIFSFIYCVFLSSFRYLGILYRTKCLFYFSNLLDIL